MKKLVLTILCLITFLFCWVFNAPDDLREIKTRGVLLVGTTGDYQPMSYFDGEIYSGFDIELSKDLAKSLGVKIKFIPTTWLTLLEDTKSKKFDIALSGITITEDRKKQALMSKGYLQNGKTILCRKEDIGKFKDLESINNTNVRVMENPGGLNEKFARKNLPKAKLIIHKVNYEIPELIASNKADVMITEVIEANYYSGINKNLAAPLADTPFTRGEIGMLLPKDNKKLLNYTNKFIHREQANGRIMKLKEKYFE